MTPREQWVPIEVTQTFLRMQARPKFDRPSAPLGPPLALMRAEAPPTWWFLALYTAVGAAHHWTDKTDWEKAALEAYVSAPSRAIYTLMRDGWPAGFFVLDGVHEGVTSLDYFGLVPGAVGRGLGTYLLKTALHTAWDLAGTERLEVDTCTIDHPAALPLYQKMGFEAYAQNTYTRHVDPAVEALRPGRIATAS
ncbi:MAG: GNAT family N-acetyltransferase [Pseudomonadota bacterium]